jgi:hypothetical protein
MRRRIVVAVLSMVLVGVTAGPAFATHPHYVDTPNEKCHQVGEGSTSKDVGHGAYHKFHFKVHKGAADADTGFFGHGNSPVHVGTACL